MRMTSWWPQPQQETHTMLLTLVCGPTGLTLPSVNLCYKRRDGVRVLQHNVQCTMYNKTVFFFMKLYRICLLYLRISIQFLHNLGTETRHKGWQDPKVRDGWYNLFLNFIILVRFDCYFLQQLIKERKIQEYWITIIDLHTIKERRAIFWCFWLFSSKLSCFKVWMS